jgi:hypothetical protein
MIQNKKVQAGTERHHKEKKELATNSKKDGERKEEIRDFSPISQYKTEMILGGEWRQIRRKEAKVKVKLSLHLMIKYHTMKIYG